MSKQQFMAELKQLLGDLPAVERDEALAYYEDYFADAGEEKEESIIEELGSPEKVAFTIKAGLNDVNGVEGEFSETGFSGYEDPYKDEIVASTASSEDRGFRTARQNANAKFWIFVLICIVLSPVILPALVSIFGVLFGIFCTIVALIFTVGVVGLSFIIVGVVFLVVAATGIATFPMGALITSGCGIVAIGLGLLGMVFGGEVIGKLLPMFIRACVGMVKKVAGLIKNKGEQII